ncbi:MAG: metallophosphoesterase [Chakrabartia sp.]
MVLRKLFSQISAPLSSRHALPPGERAYAIGDVHGRIDLLDALIAQIDADNKARGKADCWLIFLGDLIDKGPHSRAVIERALELSASPRACIFLMGNHEELLLRLWTGDARAADPFLTYGGIACLQSYGLDAPESQITKLDGKEVVAAVRDHVPETHIRFLKKFAPICQMGDYAFVHAGARPGIALADQDPLDLRWIRGDFTRSKADFGAMIVHGHTIVKTPEIRSNRIGIDTGAYASGRLTALGLQGQDRWFLST